MIRETEIFLNAALGSGQGKAHKIHGIPQIPRRRVCEGGFAKLLKQRGAQKAIEKWWDDALGLLGNMMS
ncbi:hypothetical protein [Poriferisphaera sp. WC338]|uniref:hypothetical protein n=1 Tax=Poriferisphaera sp. WC338 TaxID=3425129 RepID=UPI003D818894